MVVSSVSYTHSLPCFCSRTDGKTPSENSVKHLHVQKNPPSLPTADSVRAPIDSEIIPEVAEWSTGLREMEEMICKGIFLTSFHDLQVSFKGGNSWKHDFAESNGKFQSLQFSKRHHRITRSTSSKSHFSSRFCHPTWQVTQTHKETTVNAVAAGGSRSHPKEVALHYRSKCLQTVFLMQQCESLVMGKGQVKGSVNPHSYVWHL